MSQKDELLHRAVRKNVLEAVALADDGVIFMAQFIFAALCTHMAAMRNDMGLTEDELSEGLDALKGDVLALLREVDKDHPWETIQ